MPGKTEKTKENLKEVLKVLLEAWEKGEGPISETRIAGEISKRKEDLADSKFPAGKIYSIPKNQKNINNLFSKSRSKDYFALFTTKEGKNKYNAKLHEITPNGIFWLFREDGISFKRFLNAFSRIALYSFYRHYEQDYEDAIERIQEKRPSTWEELSLQEKALLKDNKEDATEVIKKLNNFFENHPEKRTGELLKKYLRKYDLEKYSFSDFELEAIVHNILNIIAGISIEEYEEAPFDEHEYDIISEFVTGRKEGNRFFITLFEAFEISENKS